MKFLIVLTVAAVCVLSSEAFLFGKGESSGQAYSSSQSSGQSQGYAYEAPVAQQSYSSSSAGASSSSGHGGLGGGFDISSLLQVPIQLKMKLIEAKKAKIQKLLGKFSSLGSSFGGSSSGAGANSISSSNGFSSGAAEGHVQSYQAQPAPQQNYQQQPVVLHLYQIEAQPQQQAFQSHSQSNGVASSYQAPSNTYGPPNHQPAAPISSAQVSSQAQSVDSSYLPPHGNCQDNSHYH